MLRRWLTTLLIACAVFAQSAALAHKHHGETAGIGAYAALCGALGAADNAAPGRDVSSHHQCADCIFSAELVAIGVLLLTLLIAPERAERIKAFLSHSVTSWDDRGLRPPPRAPPVFS